MQRNIGSSDSFRAVDVSGGDVVLNGTCRALFIGAAGDVVLRDGNSGSNVTFTCVAGQVLPVATTTVRQTGTSATGIVALF